ILLFALVLARAQSVGASVKTWIQIKAAHEAAEALANPNVTAKERLRVEQIYYQLVRDNPQSVPAQNALAAFLSKNGKAEAAIEHWRIAQRLQPDNGEAANRLGGAYLREGRVREAAEQFLLAVHSESGNPDYHFDLSTDRNFAYLHLARVSLKQHKKAEALSFLDKISDSSYSEVKEKLRTQAEALYP